MLVCCADSQGACRHGIHNLVGRYTCRYLITIQHDKYSDKSHVVLGEGSTEVPRDQTDSFGRQSS